MHQPLPSTHLLSRELKPPVCTKGLVQRCLLQPYLLCQKETWNKYTTSGGMLERGRVTLWSTMHSVKGACQSCTDNLEIFFPNSE